MQNKMESVEEKILQFSARYMNLSDISDSIFVLHGMKPMSVIDSWDSESRRIISDMESIGLNAEQYEGRIYVCSAGSDIGKAIADKHKHYGYPPCCVRAFSRCAQASPMHRFHDLLRESCIYEDKDLLTPFILVPYIPCGIRCEETLRRDYGGFLQRNYPYIFNIGYHSLIQDIERLPRIGNGIRLFGQTP